ncbi:hypothetical protein DIPPA_12017 [Diplonema papillatum]|nr:hypothetical protein DIPPA_12017 [Diplonema papillatum]
MGCSGSKDKKGAVVCDHCNKQIAGQYQTLKLPGNSKSKSLHSECKDDWCQRHAEKCDHCKRPMIKTVITLTVNDESVKIHPECEKDWRQATGNTDMANACYVCKKTFKDSEEVHVIACQELAQPSHVHKECIEKLHKQLGRVCDQCGKAITGQLSTISGSFGTVKLHSECVSKFKKDASIA